MGIPLGSLIHRQMCSTNVFRQYFMARYFVHEPQIPYTLRNHLTNDTVIQHGLKQLTKV